MKRKSIIVMLSLMIAAGTMTGCGEQSTSNRETTTKHASASTDKSHNKKHGTNKKHYKNVDYNNYDSNENDDSNYDYEQAADNEDTKDYDIIDENYSPNDADAYCLDYEYVPQISVECEDGHSVKLNVPEKFNLFCKEEGMDLLQTDDERKIVYATLSNVYDQVDESVCDEMCRVPYYATGEDSGVQTEVIDGRTVYYKHVSYEYDQDDTFETHVEYEDVVAICDAGNGDFLKIELGGLNKEKVSFDEIRGFFEDIEEN